jgi:hypothetical protein
MIVLRVRRHSKLASLDSNNPINTHDPRHTVLGTAHELFAMQLIPDPRAAVITVILPEHSFYLNAQSLVIDPLLTLGSFLERIIPAP